MNADVLLQFLGKGLIDVGGDDDKLARLRQAAADLSGSLEEAPTKTCPYALVAFDPDVAVSDPTIAEVENALREHWETYVNTFADTPVTVFRAILLDALVRVSTKNTTVAAAFVASARNMLPFMEVGGEREIWEAIVDEVEKNVEEHSEQFWGPPTSLPVSAIRFKLTAEFEPRIASKKVRSSSLGTELAAAAGPQYIDSDGTQQATDGNGYWPHNHPDHWLGEFSRRAAEAVGGAIDQAIGSSSVEGLDLPGFYQDIKRLLSEHQKRTLQALGGATDGLERRTRLLWWKEGLFSPTARKSYREMSEFEAAALMAFDLHRQVPTFSPASVTAFLREIVTSLPKVDQKREFPIHDVLEETRVADILQELRLEAHKLVAAPVGRGSILALVGHVGTPPQLDNDEFRDLVGLKPDTVVTLPNWSVWVFREFQAARATREASDQKPRTSKPRARRK